MPVPHDESSHRSPVAAIANWWHQWVLNAERDGDLGACPAADVDRMARDVGISSHELQRLVRRGPHAADLLFRRMAALELDPAELAETDRATLQDLERVCAFCDCKGRCKRDLARRADDAVWEDYCPNVATLKMLEALPKSSLHEA